MSKEKDLEEEPKEKQSIDEEVLQNNIPYSLKSENIFQLVKISLYGFSISCILLGAIKNSSISIVAFTLFGGLCQYIFYF